MFEFMAYLVILHLYTDNYAEIIKTKKYEPVQILSELVFVLCGKQIFEWVDFNNSNMITNNDHTLLKYTPLCTNALNYKLQVKKSQLRMECNVNNIHNLIDNPCIFEGEAVMNMCFKMCELGLGEFLYKLKQEDFESGVVTIHGGKIAKHVFESLFPLYNDSIMFNSTRCHFHVYFKDDLLNDVYIQLY